MIETQNQFTISLEEILRAPCPFLRRRHRWPLKVLLFILRPFIRLEYEERLICNSSKPIIYVFNHNTAYETLLTALYLIFRQGQVISFIIDWMYQYIPGLGWLFEQVDPVYSYHKPSTVPFLNLLRKNGEIRTVYKNCILKIKQGQSIGIYPEGTRNRDPFRLKKGHSGVGRIILETGAVVQPVGIDFPGRIKAARIPHFGPLILRIGEPLAFEREHEQYLTLNKQYCGDKTVERKKYYLVKNVVHNVMQALACVSGKIYPFVIHGN